MFCRIQGIFCLSIRPYFVQGPCLQGVAWEPWSGALARRPEEGGYRQTDSQTYGRPKYPLYSTENRPSGTLDPRVAFYEILSSRISFNFIPATDWSKKFVLSNFLTNFQRNKVSSKWNFQFTRFFYNLNGIHDYGSRQNESWMQQMPTYILITTGVLG